MDDPQGEQVRRDAGKIEAWKAWASHDGNPQTTWQMTREEAASILAELKQAERERDELGPLFIRDCCRILGVDENDYLRMDKIGTRLASVPALVEALRRIADVGSEFAVNTDRLIARAALTVYEQSQGNTE